MPRYLNVRNTLGYASISESTKHSSYDKESGQAYTEVVCKAGPMRADWVWKARGTTLDITLFKHNGPGCSSLLNMSIRKACLHVLSLTPECFEGMEWQVAGLLWKRLVALQLDSLYAWRVFAAAYPNEMEETLRHRRQAIPEPNMPVTEYIKPIRSVTYDWITFLALSHITCSRLDLVNISKLVNLGGLTIGPSVETSDIGLDDRIIRTWGRAATESEAFSMLRVLACRSQLNLTGQCFQYLSQFPSLALLAVENCSVRSPDKLVARNFGWRYSTGKDLGASVVNSGCANGSWDTIMRTLFYRCSNFGVAELTMEGVNAINSLPILHFSLGQIQGDPMVKQKGRPLLRFFEREHCEEVEPAITSKRMLAEPVDNRPVKKRGITASRKQNFEDSLIEFGLRLAPNI